MTARVPALIVMDERSRPDVVTPAVLRRLETELEWVAPPTTAAAIAETPGLEDVTVLVTGWGGPRLDADLLAAMPALRLVTVASGSVRHITTDDFWATDIPIVSAAAANAVPVIDFTIANITLALKHTFRMTRAMRSSTTIDRSGIPGAVGATVGLLSLGLIGRGVLERLQDRDVDVLCYDPYVSSLEGGQLRTLDAVFAESQVVSIHTPLLDETVGLVHGDLVRSMPFGATLINTSRGAVIDEPSLLPVLAERPDLTAVLDVTWPEPPAADSPLRTLPNVLLTGHLAGSLGREREGLGALVADEIVRYRKGLPLMYTIDRSTAMIRA